MSRRSPLSPSELHAQPLPPLALALLLCLPASAALASTESDASAEPAETTLKTVVVQAGADETATSPVTGYVAKRSATATKTDTPVAETPQAVSVVTPEQMRDQGAQTVQDALRYVAGVRSEPYGLDSRGDWSMIRGADPVIFLDGLQQTFGYYASSRPDPFTLARIDVLKGPSSVLYGQGTVGGIVNLQSKRPQAERQGELQLQLGSFDRRQLAADVTGAATAEETLLYRMVAVKRDSETQVNYVDDDRLVLMPSLTWRPTETVEWTVLFHYQKDETGSSTQFLPHAGTVLPAPNGLPEIPYDVFMSEPGFDEYDTEQTALTSLLSIQLNDDWQFRQHLRRAESEVSYQTIYPRFRPTLQANGDINRVYWIAKPELEYLTVDHQLQADFGDRALQHTWLVGVDYQAATTNRYWAYGAATPLNLYHPVYGTFTAPTSLRSDPENQVEQLGVYGQAQLTFNERWLTTLGLRHDKTENRTDGAGRQKDDATSVRAAVMYKTGTGWHPYVSYTESFQPLIGLDVYGEAFKPLQGEQVELGLKYQPDGSNSLVTVSLYDLKESNQTVSVEVNGVLGQIQAGEATAQGVELESLLQLNEDWALIGNYTYTDTAVNDGPRSASVPEHLASLWSQHRFAIAGVSGFRAGLGVRYTGDSWDGADNLKTPAYTLYDAMFGYDVGDLSFTLTVNNLENETYYSTCLARGDCFIGSKRNVIGTVSYLF
ncbi:MAG: TonB-dependent siderophore receptor [Pseudomonadota bacterium]